MGTYKKINGQAVPVTTEGHPQYYFQTKAQAEAALPTLEVGADVFVEEGGNEDVLPRVQELEEDVSEISSNLDKNNLGNIIDLTSYYGTNYYTFPSDGYVELVVSGGSDPFISAKILGADESNSTRFGCYGDDATNSIFVKKGMKYGLNASSGTSKSFSFRPIE